MTAVDENPTVDAIPTVDEMIRWLGETVAQYADLPDARIDARAQLSDYGMDSVSAFAMVSEIEDAFGVVPDITALWDHPTLGELASHLVEFISAERA